MKLWKTNDPRFIITKKRQNGLGDPFFIFWVLTERGRLEAVQRPRRTVGLNIKNPSKMRFKIFVKLTDHTCASNDLASFDSETEAIWKCRNLLGKTCEITLGELIFGGFQSFGILCAWLCKRRAWSEQTSWDDHLDWIRKQNVNKRQKGRQTLRSNTLSSFACFPMGPGSPRDMLSTTVHSGHII